MLPAGRRSISASALDAALTVSQLTQYIKALIESDLRLSWVVVRGEVSNAKLHASGHLYFTLKDAGSSIRCVMFRRYAQELKFSPRNGLAVVALGYVGVYERDGVYQLYVQRMEEDGYGLLHAALEKLKAKLEAEGLFRPERKRKLPLVPRKIGVVTSASGAAIRDILVVTYKRFPRAHVVVAPVLVQGDRAAGEIAEAVRCLGEVEGVDVIIVARGGGSMEELFAFNDERVARAIYACPVPVISGVGHETDLTIADLVADARAPTPTAAAQMAVPDELELRSRVNMLVARAYAAALRRLDSARARLGTVMDRPLFRQPETLVGRKAQEYDRLVEELNGALGRLLERKTKTLEILAARLGALDPLGVLSRGYSICLKIPSRRVVGTAAEVMAGEHVAVVLKDGELRCGVNEVKRRETANP